MELFFTGKKVNLTKTQLEQDKFAISSTLHVPVFQQPKTRLVQLSKCQKAHPLAKFFGKIAIIFLFVLRYQRLSIFIRRTGNSEHHKKPSAQK